MNDLILGSSSQDMMMMRAWAAVLVTFGPRTEAWDNGLALLPPLGWNSWNNFQCNVSSALIRAQADAMASLGLVSLGYEYVVIDDCWQAAERDDLGRLAPDASRFPEGMKALSEYVASKGLKLGIYSDVGRKTCQGFPRTQRPRGCSREARVAGARSKHRHRRWS